MKLIITNNALDKIKEVIQDNHFLLLRYDTDGFGCGVNGLPTISLVEQKENSHITVDCETIPTIIDKMQSVFFAEEMKLDFLNGMFRLSGPEGILNPFIPTTGIVD